MKKFIKNSLIFSLLGVMSLCLSACNTATDTKTDDDDTALFFDVVYQTVSTRENSNKAWVPVNGVMQMKLTQNTATQGTFIYFYRGYKEPQFVYNSCSGGFKGNFSIPSDTTTTGQDTGYDINNPYNPGNSTTDTSTSTDTSTTTNPDGSTTTVDKIQNYKFQLSITFRSLDAACRPESDHVISVSRFTNGQVVLKSEYRELLLRPVLTSETQIQ